MSVSFGSRKHRQVLLELTSMKLSPNTSLGGHEQLVPGEGSGIKGALHARLARGADGAEPRRPRSSSRPCTARLEHRGHKGS